MIRYRYWRNLVIATLGILLGMAAFAPQTQASHFRYANLAWKPTGNPGQVEFNFQFGLARNFFGGTPNLGDVVDTWEVFQFGDGTSTQLYIKITAVDAAANWMVGEMVQSPSIQVPVRKTYDGAGPFQAGFNNCCRLSNLANRGDGSLRAMSDVSPQSGNSSPVSSMVPIVNVSASTNASFFVPAIDPDGDNLRWRIATDVEATGSSTPTTPPGMTINPTTGKVTWDTLSLDQTRFWTVQFMVEDLDLNGNVKTRTPVDVLLQVGAQTGSAPELEIHKEDNSHVNGPLTVVANSTLVLTVDANDVDAGDTLTLNAGGLPAGAVMNPQLPIVGGSSLGSTFSWTPTLAQVGTHGVTFSATDNTGLQTLSSVTINVISGATIANDDNYTTPQNTALSVTAPGVLANDTDEGNNPLTAVLSSNPSRGTVTLQTDGSFVYVPEAGFSGQDEFRYRAYNGSGYSLFATVYINVGSERDPSVLTLTSSGSGTLAGVASTWGTPADGALLEIGRSYTVIATPAANNLFSHWSGSLTSDVAKLTFTMESNMVLHANFVTNLFISRAGLYNGLFSDAAGVEFKSAGHIRLKVNAKQRVSGKVSVDGDSIPFSGKMKPDGTISVLTKKRNLLFGKPDLTVNLALDFASDSDTLSGTIVQNGIEEWTSDIVAHRLTWAAGSTGLTPYINDYTMVLTNNGVGPLGSGYGLVSINQSGKTKLRGGAADGQFMKQSTAISKEGYWPLFSPMYPERIINQLGTISRRNKGFTMGWLQFTNNNGEGNLAPVGQVHWIKTTWTNDTYTSGFATATEVTGSRWVVPADSANTRAIDMTNVVLSFSHGDLATGFDATYEVAPNTRLLTIQPATAESYPNSVKSELWVIKSKGLMKGSFLHPQSGSRTRWYGAMLQDQNYGEGFFMGPTVGGKVTLQEAEIDEQVD